MTWIHCAWMQVIVKIVDKTLFSVDDTFIELNTEKDLMFYK